MSMETDRIERLVTMAERLIDALSGDIKALNEGRAREMKSTDPEILKLAALYNREAKGFQIDAVKSAPSELRARFVESTGRFREVLQQHARILTRIRSVSEGMIRAVVDDVEKKNAPMRTYSRVPAPPPPPTCMLPDWAMPQLQFSTSISSLWALSMDSPLMSPILMKISTAMFSPCVDSATIFV